MKKPFLLLAFVIILAGAAFFFFHKSGRNYSPGAKFSQSTKLTEFSESGVRVSVFMETDDHGRPILRADFNPEEAGYHLYSKDLPADGIGGLGRPTSLGLLPNPRLSAAGSLFSSVEPHEEHNTTLNTSFPVYPPGPVSLRLPVRIDAASPSVVSLMFSYMACSEETCRPPVVKKVVEVRIPAGLGDKS